MHSECAPRTEQRTDLFIDSPNESNSANSPRTHADDVTNRATDNRTHSASGSRQVQPTLNATPSHSIELLTSTEQSCHTPSTGLSGQGAHKTTLHTITPLSNKQPFIIHPRKVNNARLPSCTTDRVTRAKSNKLILSAESGTPTGRMLHDPAIDTHINTVRTIRNFDIESTNCAPSFFTSFNSTAQYAENVCEQVAEAAA